MKLISKIEIAILVILLLFFLNLPSTSKEIKNLFYLISSPIQKSFWKAGIVFSNFLEAISEIQNLKKENEELELKIQELIAESESIIQLKNENQILREALNLHLENEFELTMAEIISKDSSDDSLVINKGFKDGLKIGLPVITQQKVLVGRIIEVFGNFSRVQLITNKEVSFGVVVSEKDIYCLAKGKGNLKLSLEFVPLEKEIKIGENIFTTTLGGKFPKGILVGEIENVRKSDVKTSQEADLKPAFSLQKLNYIFIITNFENYKP